MCVVHTLCDGTLQLRSLIIMFKVYFDPAGCKSDRNSAACEPDELYARFLLCRANAEDALKASQERDICLVSASLSFQL